MINWARVEELVSEIGTDDFGEVVELFLEEVDAALAELESNPPNAGTRPILHLVKGCAWNLGFSDLGTLCAELERDEQLPSHRCAELLGLYHASRSAFLKGLSARSIAAPAA